ncbi:unnamed protein product [Arabidopsis lyrata]|nr:unnamed protein product [Arabidopsis lyrata]
MIALSHSLSVWRDHPRFEFLLPVQVAYLTSPAMAIMMVFTFLVKVPPFRH